MSGVELGPSGFSKWQAVSNTLKNWTQTGIFEEDVEIKTQDNRTDGKVINVLKCQHISVLFA